MSEPQQPSPPPRTSAGKWDRDRAARGGKADMPPRPMDPPPPEQAAPQGPGGPGPEEGTKS